MKDEVKSEYQWWEEKERPSKQRIKELKRKDQGWIKHDVRDKGKKEEGTARNRRKGQGARTIKDGACA